MGKFRDILPRERELLRSLLSPGFPGRDELVEQVKAATVRVIDDDGSLEFAHSQNVPLSETVITGIPTECEYEDSDGITAHVLLYVEDRTVKFLEFYKEDNSRVQTWPDASAVRVFAPG